MCIGPNSFLFSRFKFTYNLQNNIRIEIWGFMSNTPVRTFAQSPLNAVYNVSQKGRLATIKHDDTWHTFKGELKR